MKAHPSPQTVLIAGGVIVWALLLLAGIRWLSEYKTTPGAQNAAPGTWPAESTITRVAGRSTLVMFVHPKCPCSRASLSELNIIMDADRDHAAAFVVLLRPDGVERDWEQTGTWESAGNIPHTTRVVDRKGSEARRFGAHTSGQVVLYDTAGRLMFSGGITASRGHAGNNVGRQTVLDLLASAPTGRHGHAVFGCLMADDDTPTVAGNEAP